jgi:Fe2+ transport system protein FeoA
MKIKLSDLLTGEKGTISSLESCFTVVKRLTDLGLTKGCEVLMRKNYGSGPLIILVRGTELALGRVIADKIWVEKI